MKTRIGLRLEDAIGRCCSGPELTDALGMKARICRAILCSGSRQTETCSGVLSWSNVFDDVEFHHSPRLLARESQWKLKCFFTATFTSQVQLMPAGNVTMSPALKLTGSPPSGVTVTSPARR